MSLINDLMSLSCSLNFFSASSKASSLIWGKGKRGVRTNMSTSTSSFWFFFPTLFILRLWLMAALYLGWNSCEVFEMAADSIGFLDNRVHAQLGDLVNERVLITLPVLHHCGQQRENCSHCTGNNNTRRPRSIQLYGSFTKILPAFVLVDVDVDLFDGLQSLSQLGPVRVVLWHGPQQLHQQQRVTHHPLHRLD